MLLFESHQHPSLDVTVLEGDSAQFMPSGTIILSHKLPDISEPLAFASALPSEEDALSCKVESRRLYAPLLGYIPPPLGFLPAANETWLEIDRGAKQITLYRGETIVKQILAEGSIPIDNGVYSLQHKQKNPSWYAPDDYFVKRQLAVPPADDQLRYRKGALGQFALFPTTTFPIHSGPIWTTDVGGLKVSKAELVSIYYMLPVGASVVVK